jgi:glutamyl-tRNA reductase
MSIFVIGINHKTAALDLREKIYFAVDKLPLYLQDLLTNGLVQEAVLLSTCNRSELYCHAETASPLCEWLCAQAALPSSSLAAALYVYQDEEAIAHMMSVACGLDSMVLGEPQILGQMKEAFSESCAANAIGTLFHRLFQQIFAVAKEIRTATAIGACPVSVASAAIHFAKMQTHLALSHAQVTLLGAGETCELFVRYLQPQITKPLYIVNRNKERALALAERYQACGHGFEALPQLLANTDIIFTATGSATPIITYNMMANAMLARNGKPFTIIDVAVPRDVEETVNTLPHVALYCIDDLKVIIEKNRQGREHAAEKAREMIRIKSQELMSELKSLDHVAYTIRAYRGQIEAICKAELLKAKQQLAQGINPQEVLDIFAHAFVKKLLHAPSVQLRQAGAEGRFELLRYAKQLFAIPDPDIERL